MDLENLQLQLREVEAGDLGPFFEHQQDPVAVRMAAFTSLDPSDRRGYLERWDRILADDSVVSRTILLEGAVAGHIVRFERLGLPEISYWIGREFWGRGLATAALALFLEQVSERPLYARAAADNLASIRVLEKCGFRTLRRESAFAAGRGESIDELLLQLT